MQFNRSALPSDGAGAPPVHTQGLADALYLACKSPRQRGACAASAKALSTLVDAATSSKDMFVQSINWRLVSSEEQRYTSRAVNLDVQPEVLKRLY